MADVRKNKRKNPPKAPYREKTFDSVTSEVDEERLRRRNEVG